MHFGYDKISWVFDSALYYECMSILVLASYIIWVTFYV